MLGAGLLLIDTPFAHPWLLLWALIASSCVFSALGLVAGLWAERWDNMAVLINYVLTPLIFLGGVFYSTENLPPSFRWVNEINPIFYVVSSVRYAILDQADVGYGLSMTVVSTLAFCSLLWALQLFRSRNIDVHYIYPRVEHRLNGESMEVDLLLEDDSEVVVVEVKSTLTVTDVQEFLADLDGFLRFFPALSIIRSTAPSPVLTSAIMWPAMRTDAGFLCSASAATTW